jgi:hypothetical protein
MNGINRQILSPTVSHTEIIFPAAVLQQQKCYTKIAEISNIKLQDCFLLCSATAHRSTNFEFLNHKKLFLSMYVLIPLLD